MKRKMLKQFVLIGILILIIINSSTFVFAFTDQEMPIEGTEDVEKENENLKRQPDIQIFSTDDFLLFAEIVNNGNPMSGLLIQLEMDIDLTEIEWIPIGNSDSIVFSGFFNGNGFSVINLTTSKYTEGGLFGYLSTARVENVTLISPFAPQSTDGFYYSLSNTIIENSETLWKKQEMNESAHLTDQEEKSLQYLGENLIHGENKNASLGFYAYENQISHFFEYTKEWKQIKTDRRNKRQFVLGALAAIGVSVGYIRYKKEGKYVG